MEKIQIFINKSVYLGLSTLEINKIIMHEFYYDYVEPKNGEKAELRYMDTDSFIKTEDIYLVIAKDVETRFNTSNHESEKPLPKVKIKK